MKLRSFLRVLAFASLFTCAVAAPVYAKSAADYYITCEEAEKYVTRFDDSWKQSGTKPAEWTVRKESWYGKSDYGKERGLATLFTHVKCTSKNNVSMPITVFCDGYVVGKTDYTGRPFLLRVMP